MKTKNSTNLKRDFLEIRFDYVPGTGRDSANMARETESDLPVLDT